MPFAERSVFICAKHIMECLCQSIQVIATPEDNAMGEKYFVERRDEFIAMMQKHGTIWFFGLCTSTIIHDSCISKSGNEQT